MTRPEGPEKSPAAPGTNEGSQLLTRPFEPGDSLPEGSAPAPLPDGTIPEPTLGWPEAWDYTVGERTHRFLRPDRPGAPPPILQLALFHPLSDHYGLAPLEAAQVSLDVHNAASAWAKALIDNSARPSGALVYQPKDGGNLTDDQFQRLKRELEEGFQGARNAGRPLRLEGGLDWRAMGYSPKDLDFIEAKREAAREIALAFGVPPMLLGVAWGNGLAATGNRTGIGRRHSLGHRVRQGISLLTAAALIVLGVWIALPARVPPVVDAQGHAIPGSVADIGAVSLGGNQQWIQARGANPANPVILYIPGGPGQSDFAQSRALLQPLEDDFTVVTWDQRGNGRSYASFDPSGITLDAAVSDLVALANHLRERFDEEKIYLLGESWGTIPAVLAAQRHPGLFHALIGSGQMVDVAATDRLIYDDLLVWADAHDPGLAARLRGFGPPPYRDLWSYSVFLENYPHLAGAYNPPQAYLDRHAASGAGFFGIMGTEYPPVDKLNVLRGLMDTFDVLYPQLQDLDFRREVTSLEVPIYLFEGAHELRGRREPLDEWYQRLHAPTKGVFRFETGGHAVAFEHADDLDRILSEIIVPATYRR